MESLVGRVGIFTGYEDMIWGEEYAGKKAKISSCEFHSSDWGELTVQFEDGKQLTIGNDEFELI